MVENLKFYVDDLVLCRDGREFNYVCRIVKIHEEAIGWFEYVDHVGSIQRVSNVVTYSYLLCDFVSGEIFSRCNPELELIRGKYDNDVRMINQVNCEFDPASYEREYMEYHEHRFYRNYFTHPVWDGAVSHTSYVTTEPSRRDVNTAYTYTGHFPVGDGTRVTGNADGFFLFEHKSESLLTKIKRKFSELKRKLF